MQDPSIYAHINAQPQPQFPEHEQLKCPRCDSTNTKFCYYNNYNLSQPRHFCKSCRRYWTKGGVLRNIPVGGGSRKNTKRSSSSSSSSAASGGSSSTSHHPKRPAAGASIPSPSPAAADAATVGVGGTKTETFRLKENNYEGQFGDFLGVSGSFSSLLGSSAGQYGNLMDGLSTDRTNLQMGGSGFDTGTGQDTVQNVDPQLRLEGGGSDGFLNVQGDDGDSTCWNAGNGWPDLAMYAPGSTFR